jgi:hypothetical protein
MNNEQLAKAKVLKEQATEKFIQGKTEKCIVGNCGKDAVHHDGVLLKSRDVVIAGFCEHHWFITKCPNFKGIKNCYGIFYKGLGIKNL